MGSERVLGRALCVMEEEREEVSSAPGWSSRSKWMAGVAVVATICAVGLMSLSLEAEQHGIENARRGLGDDIDVVDLSAEDATIAQESLRVSGSLATLGDGKPAMLELMKEQDDGDATHSVILTHGGVEFGGKPWHKDLGGINSIPTLNADKLMAQAHKGEDGAHKTFFVCHQHHDISKLKPMQIIKVEPRVSKIPGLNFDNSVVHHMSIFLCTAEESKNGNIGRCEEGPKPVVPHDTMHRPCYGMAYTYDRDALPFTFPKNVGVRVGKGTPYTRIVQEWHYLLPKKGLQGKKFTDRTHFKITFTDKLRPHNAAMVGLM